MAICFLFAKIVQGERNAKGNLFRSHCRAVAYFRIFKCKDSVSLFRQQILSLVFVSHGQMGGGLNCSATQPFRTCRRRLSVSAEWPFRFGGLAMPFRQNGEAERP